MYKQSMFAPSNTVACRTANPATLYTRHAICDIIYIIHRLNFHRVQTGISSIGLGCDISWTHPWMEENTTFGLSFAMHHPQNVGIFTVTNTFWEPTELFKRDGMILKGSYIHYLVTKAETKWSNCIVITPCPDLTMIGYGSLDKITLS